MTPPVQWATAIDEWLTSLRAAGQPETTIRTRRQQLSQLATSGHGDPWDLTLDDLLDYMGSQRWALETRHAHRSALRGFYAWAKRRGHVDVDPALELPRVRRTPPRARPLPEDHAVAAIANADEREALMVRLAGEHGLRRAEIAVVHTRDVQADLFGYSLVVHGKGGRTRLVPLDDLVAVAILDAEGYAFPGQIDGHLSPAWVGKLVQRLLPRGWTTHTLRHRFATRTYATSADVFGVQALLGHASPATTLRYVQLPDDTARRIRSTAGFGPLEPVHRPQTRRPQTHRFVVSNLPQRGTA
jgi:integrase/recombinase XerC